MKAAASAAKALRTGRGMRSGSWNVAGAAGFEPAHAGTKNRCLTAWLRPNRREGGPYSGSPGARKDAPGAPASPVRGDAVGAVVAVDRVAVGPVLGPAERADFGRVVVRRALERGFGQRHDEAALVDVVSQQRPRHRVEFLAHAEKAAERDDRIDRPAAVLLDRQVV